MFCYVLILLIYCIYDVRSASNMEGNIVGGDNTTISKFPHSAGLLISYQDITLRVSSMWLCGSSIVNQRILLTAAHCFEESYVMLPKNIVTVEITVGSTYLKDKKYEAANYKTHEEYNSKIISCDIALVYVREHITLGDNIKRILIPVKLPLEKLGYLAGWGVTSDVAGQISPTLKSLKQEIESWSECQRYLKTAPGTICARMSTSGSHADRGDSGSALVVKDFIAVGLVSYKHNGINNPVTVYTAVHHYYKWIKKNARKLYCSGRRH